MPDLNISYQWSINACNNPNIGYSQAYRRGQTINGITYYDCSSFISAALTAGGFFTTNPWFVTWNMPSYLAQAGFIQMETTVAWLPGDILLNSGHTEMCYQGGEAGQGGITMGAHTDGVPLSEQVSINNYTTSPSYYTSLWRYPGGATTLNWIYGNYYLSESEMQNNAYVFYSYMFFKGYTLNSIAGMLGNFQVESTINPGIWQDLDEGNYNVGFGLAQWTPATNYTNWANANGYEITDGNGQCEWLDSETVISGQWIQTDEYPISWDEYKLSSETPEYCASAFLKNFERAGVEKEEERQLNARRWYDYLENLSPYPPTPQEKKKMPLYFYLFP